MNRFTTRVELHGATDYDLLHEEMEKEGFTRTIFDDETGVEYHLPTAEYNKVGDYTKEEVLASAESAAKKTKKKYSILVTKSAGRFFSNLEVVKNPLI